MTPSLTVAIGNFISLSSDRQQAPPFARRHYFHVKRWGVYLRISTEISDVRVCVSALLMQLGASRNNATPITSFYEKAKDVAE